MYRTLLVMGLLLATQAGVSQSKRKALDDNTLDRVTAAGVATRVLPGGVINFTGEVPTANGLVIRRRIACGSSADQHHDLHNNGDREPGWNCTAESEFVDQHQCGEFDDQCVAQPERQHQLDSRNDFAE